MTQCSAEVINPKSANFGKRCAKDAMKGQDVCVMHGGVLSDAPRTLGAQVRNPRKRCEAHKSSTGEPCKRWAIKGGTVCSSHGGQLPVVRKSARDRLLDLLDPALREIGRILDSPAADDAVKARVAQMVMDRTGFGPGATLTHEMKPYEELMMSGMIYVPEDEVEPMEPLTAISGPVWVDENAEDEKPVLEPETVAEEPRWAPPAPLQLTAEPHRVGSAEPLRGAPSARTSHMRHVRR